MLKTPLSRRGFLAAAAATGGALLLPGMADAAGPATLSDEELWIEDCTHTLMTEGGMPRDAAEQVARSLHDATDWAPEEAAREEMSYWESA